MVMIVTVGVSIMMMMMVVARMTMTMMRMKLMTGWNNVDYGGSVLRRVEEPYSDRIVKSHHEMAVLLGA